MAERIFYADLREEQIDELLTYLPPLTQARMEGIRARFEAATAGARPLADQAGVDQAVAQGAGGAEAGGIAGVPEAGGIAGVPEAVRIAGVPEAGRIAGVPGARGTAGVPGAGGIAGVPEAGRIARPETQRIMGVRVTTHDEGIPALDAPRSRRSRQTLRWVAACAALLLLSTSIGLAATNRIDIREMLNTFFGGRAKQEIRLGDSAIQNGIEMTLVSAYMDGQEAYAKVRVRDTTGKRLTEEIAADVTGEAGYDAFAFRHEGDTTVPTDQTELNIDVRFGDPPGKGKPIRFTVHSIGIGPAMYEEPTVDFTLKPYFVEREGISIEALQDQVFGVGVREPFGTTWYEKPITAEAETYLPIDAYSLELPGINWAVISNIGLIDGRLHIQVRRTDAFNYRYNWGSLGLRGADGKRIQELFAVDLGPYNELVFDIGHTRPEDLQFYCVAGEGSKSAIEGPWTLTFTPMDTTVTREVHITPENVPLFARIDVQTTTMKTIVNVRYADPNADETAWRSAMQYCDANADAALILKNGTVIELQRQSMVFDNDAGEIAYSTSYFDIDELRAIRLFGVEYPFE